MKLTSSNEGVIDMALVEKALIKGLQVRPHLGGWAVQSGSESYYVMLVPPSCTCTAGSFGSPCSHRSAAAIVAAFTGADDGN